LEEIARFLGGEVIPSLPRVSTVMV
jgi:hypothetical protein